MMPRLFVALLLPLAARAQLVLVSVDGTTESPVGSTYDFASVAASDAKDVRFRARNTGSSAVTVTTLAVNGAGFTVDRPSLPFVIAPGNFLGFTVHFAPAASERTSRPRAIAGLHEGANRSRRGARAPRLAGRCP